MANQRAHKSDLGKFLDVASDAAVRAGAEIMTHYGNTSAEKKQDASLITWADVASDEVINDLLSSRFPSHAQVSEERYDDPRRFTAQYTWIIDPLDGTRDFVKKTGQFAVQIGLVRGTQPVLGVVYVPVEGALYFAAPELFAGARKSVSGNTTDLHVNDCDLEKAVLLLSSNKFSERDAEEARIGFGAASVYRMGGLGCKMMAIANGSADVYIYERQKAHEWDTLAPEVILRAACGQLTDYFGNPLSYNVQRTGVFTQGLVCASERIHSEVLEKVQRVIPLVPLPQ